MSEFNWKNSFNEQQRYILDNLGNGGDDVIGTLVKGMASMLDQISEVVNGPGRSAEIGDAVIDLMELWSKIDV